MDIRDRFWGKVDDSGECWLWTKHRDGWGYGVFEIKGKRYMAHRIAWEMTFGEIPKGQQLDHICRNPACVRLEHLRYATNAQNACNTPGKAHSSTGFKGVSYCKQTQKWRARIRVGGGKRISLGRFDTPEEAYAKYLEAAREAHGEFFFDPRKNSPPSHEACKKSALDAPPQKG